MTLDDIIDSLPHGLHDAVLVGLAVDYVALSAQIELEICAGD